MRHLIAINTSTSSSSSSSSDCNNFRNLRSPIPYLFGGLALMLALIAAALLILACSHRRRQSFNSSANSGAQNDEEKSSAATAKTTTVDLEPKILVIMAGDSDPTYLAKPLYINKPETSSSSS